MKYNAFVPSDNDKRVKGKAVYDNDGSYFSLTDGYSRWKERKSYTVNFSKICYALGVEEMKKADNNGTLGIDKKTGEVFDSPEAKRYFKKAYRMRECGSKLTFKVDDKGEKRLALANFCRDRLCPMCMWRLSRRLTWEMNQVFDRYMIECPNMVPIMMTLTVKNPRMGELSDMLDVLCHGKSAAWQLLQKWLGRRGIKDYNRTVEVTFNYKTKTWHPHLHILAFVPKEYFAKDNKNYISHSVLAEEWKRLCKLDYTPVVDIRRCYDKKSGDNERIDFDSDIKTVSFSAAIKEVCKYCVKPLEIFSNFLDDYSEDDSDNKEEITIYDVVGELDGGMAGRRLRAFGGRIKEIAHKLKFDEDEDKKDLIHSDENNSFEAVYEEVYEYVFKDRDYYLTSRVLLEEKRLADNILSVDEICGGNLELDTT
jgi:plasmid rolling circle replication initiator protein Rep